MNIVQSDSLRILLIEGDKARADEHVSLFAAADHSATPVETLEEATEALFIQKFDAVLLCSACPREGLAAFAAALLELGERSASRIPFLSCSSTLSDTGPFDACLDDPAELAEVVKRLRSQTRSSDGGRLDPTSTRPVFEPEDFGEQCAHEKELMVEIIDLFFVECQTDLPAMGETLALNQFERLSRIAHTIKGSLGSLHAPLARERAEALEAAAKGHDYALCSEILGIFERDIEQLNGHLSAFRQACLNG